ncbi:MAG: dTDP-L-rhamnose 4-epimerase [Candidatus Ordinivivax streblomastigis]|uniref:dTDP-L-rhamnose 4-epimerase n=1 Tax=Candidatus Ordinivivax streblomastigis TaxID=2540710 RepID=A0A5M8P228_9BACT|nr:MAG: dTDP-L-rhamnose 4-epimerase [Candidatus Ordinivivax streblomastigis]
MKKLLITGGAGFIGSNLIQRLYQTGYTITVLDNLSPQIHGKNPIEDSLLYKSIIGKVNFLEGSVTNVNDWRKVLKNQDIIVHLAAETGTGQSMYEIKKYTDVNIGGTALLLDLLTNTSHSIKKMVVASSRAIYGEGKYLCAEHGDVFPLSRSEMDMLNGDFACKCPMCGQVVKLQSTNEESKMHPTSVYGITKQNQEQMVLTVCKSLGISAVGLRYQNVYGVGQSLSNPYTGILSIFSTRIKNGNDLNIFEDGKESRDFVYIDDVVRATISAIEEEKIENDVFNIGTGVTTDVLTVAKTLIEKYKSNSKIVVSGNFRLGDIRHNFADISKANKMLNYMPEISFQEGIELFCNWVNSQDILDDNYDQSIEEMKQKGLYK